MAVFVWGRPRFTADIDIVITLQRKSIAVLAEALNALSEMSYIDIETMQHALERKGEFNFIDGASGIKVDFFISGENDFEHAKIIRRVEKTILGYGVYFISPEDLVLSKLLWHRQGESSRQLEDIESVLKIQKKLDWKYLQKWSKRHSTFAILLALRKKDKI